MTNKNTNTGKSKRSNRLLTFLLIAFAAVFIGSAFMLGKELIRGKKEKDAFSDMAEQLHSAVENAQYEDKSAEELTQEQYARMKQKNEHFVGWISIADTGLDYPVMHTPADPEYYLRRAFDKSYSISGTPFLGYGCDVNSVNVLIYGHRMNNDTMFTPLLDYAKKDFWEVHKEIRFDTVDEIRSYEVVAAFYIDIPTTDDTDAFRWYNYCGDLKGEDFDYYVQQVKAHAYYDTGIEIAEGDKLITLTTCAYNDEEQRFVVVAKLKQ